LIDLKKEERTFWYSNYLERRDIVDDGRFKTDPDNANLIASLLEDGMHAPVMDIDFSARLIPSSTSGHFHLYFNKLITWRQYRHLLKGFYKSGLMARSTYIRAIQRGMSHVRCPNIPKLPSLQCSETKYFFVYCVVYLIAYKNLVKWNIGELIAKLFNR